jgi:hypothetical protein
MNKDVSNFVTCVLNNQDRYRSIQKIICKLHYARKETVNDKNALSRTYYRLGLLTEDRNTEITLSELPMTRSRTQNKEVTGKQSLSIQTFTFRSQEPAPTRRSAPSKQSGTAHTSSSRSTQNGRSKLIKRTPRYNELNVHSLSTSP